MDLINLLIANEDKIDIKCSPNLLFDKDGGLYVGVQVSPYFAFYRKRNANPVLISLNINFKSDNDELFNKLRELISSIKPKVICFDVVDPIQINHNKKIKDEFQERVNTMKAEHEKKLLRISELSSEMYKLGVISEIKEYPQLNIPNEYYEIIETKKRVLPHISVVCEDKSIIYLALEKTGLLRKYLPDWYKNGCPYCIGEVWF